MLKALVPVDGSENSLAAIRHVIKLTQAHEPLEIHLLNVQPPLRSDVTTFVPERAVHDYHVDEAQKALKPACELLDDAGVPYTKHVFVGHPPKSPRSCMPTRSSWARMAAAPSHRRCSAR